MLSCMRLILLHGETLPGPRLHIDGVRLLRRKRIFFPDLDSLVSFASYQATDSIDRRKLSHQRPRK